MAAEPVRIRSYLDAADTNSTLQAVQRLGALVAGRRRRARSSAAPGLRDAAVPDGPIDVGNAGTLMRLLPGWLAAQEGRAYTLDGDASIRRRPVDRIAEPLRLMGAEIDATDGRLPPFTVTGAPPALDPLRAAGGQRAGQVVRAARRAWPPTAPPRSSEPARQPRPHRADAGRRRGRPCTATAATSRSPAPTSSRSTSSSSRATRRARPSPSPPACSCPARGSSCAASASNWTRSGFVRIAQRMGGDRHRRPRGRAGRRGRRTAEPIARPRRRPPARSSGTVVEADEVPLAIDELPLVALLGCFAEGETVVRGAQELRLKETDRIATVVDGPRAGSARASRPPRTASR